MRFIPFAMALAVAMPLAAETAPLPVGVATALAGAPAGSRIGLLAVDDSGREIVAIRPDERFIPASNTKLFTTAAALALAQGNLQPPAASTLVGLAKGKGKTPDVVITGDGSISLSTTADCTAGCLAPLLDRIAAMTRTVGDVIADDTAFTDQRWSPGMSWNNIGTVSGTATSALVIDDNEVPVTITPGVAGAAPTVATSPYFTVINEAQTVPGDKSDLRFDRSVGSRRLRVYGSVAAGAGAVRDAIGLDDPADYAGWLVAAELARRGVKMRGAVRTLHRPVGRPRELPRHDFTSASGPAPAPLQAEVDLINKRSQNLHAELMLRRLAAYRPSTGLATAQPGPVDTLEQGLAAARDVFASAGVTRAGYEFADGSGMSTYNRVSPRAAVALLRWGASQPWGPAWRASLPIGGVDGTLRRRFVGTPLAGRIFAKTGTLNATDALSGWLVAASGREVTFSIFANDVPDGSSAVPTIDAALLALAAVN